ncbi:MAG: cell division protein FtsL [Pseudomonadota bacterium]
MKQQALLVIVLLLLIASTLNIVIVRHESRQLFVESQELRAQSIELGREWGRLLLEQGTLVTQNRIEQVAKDKLAMNQPTREDILVLGND